MARPRVLTESDEARAVAMRRRKQTYGQIAGALGVSPDTIGRFFRGEDGSARLKGMPASVQQAGPASMDRWEGLAPPPKSWAELTPFARECLEDFPRFCAEVMGEPLQAHQRRWHDAEIEAQRAGNLFNMLNVHPRSGKTHKDNLKCIWILAGGGHPHEWYRQEDPPLRDARIMLVAGAENQSDKNFEYIQVRLAEHGRLIKEYGRFKVSGNIWRPSRGVLVVDGRRKLFLAGDHSLTCVGTLSHVLGRGADHIICDDPFDSENIKSSDQAERGLKWLRASIFGRLEPGGTVTVLGAKLPVASEPYSAMARWPGDLDLAGDDDPDPDEDSDDHPRLFHTVVEPAVLDWENRVVLCPERFSWRDLMKARRLAGPEIWEASWMQNPQGADATLARREWFYGGQGTDPTSGLMRQFPGCMDADRSAGASVAPRRQTSTGLEIVPGIRVVSVDPSDVKWWGIHCLDLFKTPRAEGFRPVLIDLDRNKHTTASFLALIEGWWKDYDFKVIVLERNISKFLLENDSFTDFCARTGVKVIRHHTGDNRNHPRWGVGALRDDIMEGRIRIPNADAETRWKFQYFVKEALGELATDDTLLSLWFVKFNLAGLLTLASTESNWAGWAGAPGRHKAPPARVGKGWGARVTA